MKRTRLPIEKAVIPQETTAPDNAHATPTDLARHWQTTEAALAQQRYRGDGPEYMIIGRRRILYSWEAIHAYEAENTVRPGAA
ncbi:hypothetical protein [Nocardia sp. R7R-8]|uniref:hypothetical protein n=1 Tax=Nocardia sp. R7R-8 TaxID=3459304 RepID=UPI00403D8033